MPSVRALLPAPPVPSPILPLVTIQRTQNCSQLGSSFNRDTFRF
ncbi:hypothetical protein M3J09_011401 [Ascochyta lentis]